MMNRTTAPSVLLAAAGVVCVALGLVVSAPWLTGIGLLLSVASGVVALSGVLSNPVSDQTASTWDGSTSRAALRPKPSSPAPAVPARPAQADESADPTAGTAVTCEPQATEGEPIEQVHEPAEAVTEFLEPDGSEPAEVLDALAANAASVGSVVAAHLWMLDETTQTLRLVGSVGHSPETGAPVPVLGSPIAEAIEDGASVLIRITGAHGLDSRPITWRYALPLGAHPVKGAAVLDVETDEPDREVLARVAAHSAPFLSASLAVHVANTETAAAEVLLQAVSEIIRLVDEEAILNAALDRAVELSAAHTGSIMLCDENSRVMRIHVSQGLPSDVASGVSVAEGEGIAGWVLAAGKPMVVEDLDDRGPRSRRHGIRSAVAVPIADDDGVLGVLNVGSRTFHARFSSTHLSALESIGRILALALRNARAHAASRELYLETVKALALAQESKDPYTKGSTERILALSTRIGEAAGLSGVELQGLRIAALLHDIGMTAAGDLHSVGDRPLSTLEWSMLKLHPMIAADVLSEVPSLRAAVPIVSYHHEHYDGGGYTHGIAGDDIPIGARVLAVADSFVAMTSPRAYRKALTPEQAMQELKDRAGSQYDPDVVALFAGMSEDDVDDAT